MSAVVLFHQSNKSMDPKTGLYYDPWSSHMLDMLDQIRTWNAEIPIHFVVDAEDVPPPIEFNQRNVNFIPVSSLRVERDIGILSDYFGGDPNPLWRSSFMRFFYIEQVIRDYSIQGAFTFDNDVLVYEDLLNINKFFSLSYKENAITRIDQNGMICGMVWFRNENSIRRLNDSLIEAVKLPQNRKLPECNLLNVVWRSFGDSLLGDIPIWFDGTYSEGCSELGGFFDPLTIGQYLGGCHNGSPKHHIMMHHEIGPRLMRVLKSGTHTLNRIHDENGRGYYAFVSTKTSQAIKLHSLHIHSKKMKEFMSRV